MYRSVKCLGVWKRIELSNAKEYSIVGHLRIPKPTVTFNACTVIAHHPTW